MPQIQKTAVLGAGTMGSRIAAHMANAGVEVILLDIVPDDAGNDRNKLAKTALEKLSKNGHAFTFPTNAQRITPGNFEDDMDKLGECEWVVEAVIEKPEIKKDLYKKVDEYRKEGSILSSNTSTIPLKKLKEGQSAELKNDLVITHFFNPPRQMRLMELVTGKPSTKNGLENVIDFADRKLGKTVVQVRDTPGFIGNRLGLFWMLTGLEQALEKNVPVPMADAIMGKKLGFPKTGIFGLFDMVGVDLMKELGHSLRGQLLEDDAYQGFNKAMEFLDNMEQGSFYKKENGKRLPLNLQTGKYEEPPAYNVENDLSLASILIKQSEDSEYARAVLLRTLNYACTCLPEIAESVHDADTVMKLGFNWKQGPFEMIDALAADGKPGTVILIGRLEDNDLIPAPFLQKARSGPFYKTQKDKLYYLAAKDGFKPKTVSRDKWSLADKTRGQSPVLESDKAKLWDIGDGIACLQLTTKFDTMSPETFDLIHEALEKVESDFNGMIIGDDDKHFSAGLDLNLVLEACEKEDWMEISRIIRYGQQTMLKIKRSPFPVVGAPSGKALGGACEMLLHCDAIQAYSESHIGLVEVRIGLVPAWGGCTQMLLRHLRLAVSTNSELQACEAVFNTISHAKTSSSAEDFTQMIASQDNLGITMNRERLLHDAKQRCLSLVLGYEPPGLEILEIPQAAAKSVFHNVIDNCEKDKSKTPHECNVLRCLAHVLSGGADGPEILGDLERRVIEDRMNSGAVPNEIDELHMMDLEHDAFMALIKTKQTQKKIKEVL